MDIVNRTATEITARFPHTTDFASCPDLDIDGQRWAKAYGNLITPDLADRRRAMGGWSEAMCTPARIVVYVPETSALISALYGAR